MSIRKLKQDFGRTAIAGGALGSMTREGEARDLNSDQDQRSRSERPDIPQPPLLTIPQAAALLAISERTVRRLISSRELASIRVGVQVRLDQRDLLRWISARREG